MTDTKARRVRLFNLEQFCEGRRVGIEEMVMDDPNGDHMLVPVEVWERVKAALENSYYTVSSGVAFESLKAALAEMGGSDD